MKTLQYAVSGMLILLAAYYAFNDDYARATFDLLLAHLLVNLK